MGVSVGEKIAKMLPESSTALRGHVRKMWGHVCSRIRGLDKWVRAVKLRDPTLRWVVEDRGDDRVVQVEMDAPPPPGTYGIDCGLLLARNLLEHVIHRQWGHDAHRYHWRREAERRRYAREREALERVFNEAVRSLWLPLANEAISRAMNTPLWRATRPPASRRHPEYRAGPLSDLDIAIGTWKPISPAAYKQVDQWRDRLARALQDVHSIIFRLTPEDLRDYARAACPSDYFPRVTATYLLLVSRWIQQGRPNRPAVIVDETVPGLVDAINEDVGIWTQCVSLQHALLLTELENRVQAVQASHRTMSGPEQPHVLTQAHRRRIELDEQ